MPDERESLERAIEHLETQRAFLSDAVVDASIAALRQQLRSHHPTDALPEQRKLATILFADISGFTAMSETMDAEEVRDTLNALWQQLDTVIERYGGTIDKHLGDGVMAVFGAPTAREDDPARAIQAALAMQEAHRSFMPKINLLAPHAPPIQIRIGINTGPVLLGGVGTTGEYTAIGDTVNLASRLEEAAPIGGILISHNTYRHVQGLFNVEALDPIKVRGKSESVQAYLVEGRRPRATRSHTRGVEGIDTRMIGREVELKFLKDVFTTVTEEHEAQVVTVIGEAGIGKTRLLDELDLWIANQPATLNTFKGRATEESANIPYALLRDLFANSLEIQDSDSAAVVREKLERGIAERITVNPAEKAHYIGQLVGFDFTPSHSLLGRLNDARHLQNFGFNYMMEYFVEAALDDPTLIFFEDIHWADDPSLEFVKFVMRSSPNLPFMVVCLARPSLFERHTDWGQDSTCHSFIQLRPLVKRDTRRLVQEILRHVPDIPTSLEDMIVQTTEGNPYYVEEVIKMLIEDAVILKGAQKWVVALERLSHTRVPPTLTGVIQARLDGLPPLERAVLQRAAVIGHTFWDSAVQFLETETAPLAGDIHAALESLVDKEMIYAHSATAFAATHEYRFRHNLLRDVTYESVLRRDRRIFHRHAAMWLIIYSGERVNEYMSIIAEHYVQAGLTAQAVDFLTRAGEQALQVSGYREAATSYERAIELAIGPDARLPRAYLQRQAGELYWRLGDYDKAKTLLEQCVVDYRELDDCQGLADGLSHLGIASLSLGEYARAREHLVESLNIATDLNDRVGIARSLDGLGNVALALGEYTSARTYLEQSLPIAQEVGDQWRMATCLNNLGLVAQYLGDVRTAQGHYQESLRLFREVGNPWGIAVAFDNLGDVALLLDDPDTATQHFHSGLQTALEVSTLPIALSCIAGLVKVMMRDRHYKRAAELLGLVLNHPAKDREVDERALPLLGELQGILDPTTLTDAIERGKKLDFEATCKLLLES